MKKNEVKNEENMKQDNNAETKNENEDAKQEEQNENENNKSESPLLRETLEYWENILEVNS